MACLLSFLISYDGAIATANRFFYSNQGKKKHVHRIFLRGIKTFLRTWNIFSVGSILQFNILKSICTKTVYQHMLYLFSCGFVHKTKQNSLKKYRSLHVECGRTKSLHIWIHSNCTWGTIYRVLVETQLCSIVNPRMYLVLLLFSFRR